MMHNERLAHEMLSKQNFQLDPNGPGRTDPMHRIHISFHNAFWNSLPQDLQSNPPIYNRLMRVVREINESVHKFASRAEPPAYVGVIAPGSNEVANLDQTNAVPAVVVDMNALLLRLVNSSFCWDDCKAFVGGFVETIRARQEPAELTAQWTEVSLAMDSATPRSGPPHCARPSRPLRFLMDRVSLMRTDPANRILRFLAPVIANNGVDYERGKFQDGLNSGAVERTTAWLRDVTGELGVGRLAEARLALTRGPPIQEETCPETLRLDADHLADLQTGIAELGAEFRGRIQAALVGIVEGREPVFDESLPALAPRVEEMGALLKRLAKHNNEVRYATYGHILSGEA